MPHSTRALMLPRAGERRALRRVAPVLFGLARTLGLFSILIIARPLPAEAQTAPAAPSKSAAESWKKGVDAMKSRQWIECVENMNRVIATDPGYIEGYLSLGTCQSEMRQWDAAMKAFERGLAQSPPESLKVEMLRALALAQESSGQIEPSVRTYEDLIKLRPNDKQAVVGYASALKSVDRPVDAVMAYLRALELDPKDVTVIKAAGELCQRSDMSEQAIALYESWAAFEPENVEPYRHLAFLLSQAESCDRGVEVYEKAIALDSSNPGDLLNLGLLYQKCKQYEKAMDRLQKYRATRPDTASMTGATVDCRIAFLYEDMNKTEDGIAFLRDAAAKNPDDPCLLYAWGRLLEKQGLALVHENKFADGVAAYRQAQAKLQPVVGNEQWGDQASKELKRLEQLIKIADAKRQQSESE